MDALKAVLLLFGVLAACWLVLCVISLARPEPNAPESYYPGVGEVLQSRAEGFT
jgi:hypothetical protein